MNMTSPRDQPREGLADLLNRHIALLVGLIGILSNVVVIVWGLAAANAKITRNADAITVMQSHNVPDRLHSVEDGQAAMQHDIATLQAEYREISTGLSDQSNRLATIQAQLGFVIGQLFPSTGSAQKHAP